MQETSEAIALYDGGKLGDGSGLQLYRLADEERVVTYLCGSGVDSTTDEAKIIDILVLELAQYHLDNLDRQV